MWQLYCDSSLPTSNGFMLKQFVSFSGMNQIIDRAGRKEAVCRYETRFLRVHRYVSTTTSWHRLFTEFYWSFHKSSICFFPCDSSILATSHFLSGHWPCIWPYLLDPNNTVCHSQFEYISFQGRNVVISARLYEKRQHKPITSISRLVGFIIICRPMLFQNTTREPWRLQQYEEHWRQLPWTTNSDLHLWRS